MTARLLADLREALPRIRQSGARLRILDLSLVVESKNFRASALLREQLPEMTRRQREENLQTRTGEAGCSLPCNSFAPLVVQNDRSVAGDELNVGSV